jgi:hypothetical protein
MGAAPLYLRHSSLFPGHGDTVAAPLPAALGPFPRPAALVSRHLAMTAASRCQDPATQRGISFCERGRATVFVGRERGSAAVRGVAGTCGRVIKSFGERSWAQRWSFLLENTCFMCQYIKEIRPTGCLVREMKIFGHHIGCFGDIGRGFWILIKKLIAQLVWKLRDESIKPN